MIVIWPLPKKKKERERKRKFGQEKEKSHLPRFVLIHSIKLLILLSDLRRILTYRFSFKTYVI